MNYEETIRNLFDILYQANLADTDSAKDWQKPGDASGRDGVYHHISKAIEILAGKEVLEHCCDTGEPDMSLCDRHVTEHQSLTLQDIKGLEWVDYEGEDLDTRLARRLMSLPMTPLRKYTVLYTIVGQIGGLDRVFCCMAEDTLHAVNQAINAVLSEDEVIDSISQVDWVAVQEVADESSRN